MTAQDPLEYLSGLSGKGMRLSLGPVSQLLDRLNNPQEKYRTVLVGGTNGKGSIAAMISSILSEGGARVGLYTSPHLIDIRERMRVNNRMISIEELSRLIEEVRGEVKEDITYFELVTTLAFLHFYRSSVEVAVLEVGMGGRLDATNVVIPEVSVISNISLEHREHLGNNLGAVAREKAGIIKDGGVCITAARQKSVLGVLEDICSERKARLYRLGKDIKVRAAKGLRPEGTYTPELNNFSYKGIEKNYGNLVCPLTGRHQMENAAVALGTIELLAAKGVGVDEDVVTRGLRNVRWEGRLEVLQNSPMLVVDGAHNPAGASALRRALREKFSYRKLILMFGVLGDKDYKIMLKKLAPLADRLILTEPKEKRVLHLGDILPVAKMYINSVDVVEDSDRALSRAFALAGKDDLICVTGSLFLVGEIKKRWNQKSGFRSQESE
ncbi:MAG: folylpolyglutamate synthase/dihydrofolate synthase family protein [Thermodesulfobacteriota bacterium]|nr:folylpolyglutamate synthase/dihydrofolate synthase family protein [Thermodesulfobacteriota bacterium]